MDLERCWIVAYRAWGCAVGAMDMQVYGYGARRQTGKVHVPSWFPAVGHLAVGLFFSNLMRVGVGH